MTPSFQKSLGQGRTQVSLTALRLGQEHLLTLSNAGAHLGAVAVSETHAGSGLVSTSVLTRLGHKDDLLAQRAAYAVAKRTGQAACAVAGVHVESITAEEIEAIVENARRLVEAYLEALG